MVTINEAHTNNPSSVGMFGLQIEGLTILILTTGSVHDVYG